MDFSEEDILHALMFAMLQRAAAAENGDKNLKSDLEMIASKAKDIKSFMKELE
jgi:hypothetical protein